MEADASQSHAGKKGQFLLNRNEVMLRIRSRQAKCTGAKLQIINLIKMVGADWLKKRKYQKIGVEMNFSRILL